MLFVILGTTKLYCYARRSQQISDIPDPETHLLTAHMLQPRRLASQIFVLCKENRLPVCAALLSPGPSYNTAQNIDT